MSLTFPSGPTIGQEYTSDGLTFVWSGAVWYVRRDFPWATEAETIAGTAADRVVTPLGLKAIVDANPIGAITAVGTPTVVTRSLSTNYQNTMGYPMMVAVNMAGNGTEDSNYQVQIGPSNPADRLVYSIDVRRGGDASCQFVVPASWYYRLVPTRGPIITRVTEWR